MDDSTDGCALGCTRPFETTPFQALSTVSPTPAEPCPTRLALPAEFRAKTAADVLALLNEQLETLRQDASLGSVERAKGVGYLAGIASRAIEAGDTAARLEALESILKSRPKERAA